MRAIMKAFDDIGMPELKDRMVLLASNSASVNSGIKTGLTTKFCEDGIDWLAVVWCLSHWLELTLKDGLDDVLNPVKKSLTNLFYLYHKSSKKLRELRKLHTVLKEMYEFDDNRVKPAKPSGRQMLKTKVVLLLLVIQLFVTFVECYIFENRLFQKAWQ